MKFKNSIGIIALAGSLAACGNGKMYLAENLSAASGYDVKVDLDNNGKVMRALIGSCNSQWPISEHDGIPYDCSFDTERMVARYSTNGSGRVMDIILDVTPGSELEKLANPASLRQIAREAEFWFYTAKESRDARKRFEESLKSLKVK